MQWRVQRTYPLSSWRLLSWGDCSGNCVAVLRGLLQLGWSLHRLLHSILLSRGCMWRPCYALRANQPTLTTSLSFVGLLLRSRYVQLTDIHRACLPTCDQCLTPYAQMLPVTDAGSSSPTQFPCGGPQVYCPAATGTPISLIGRTDVYSIPGTGLSATTQTGTAPCPFQRLCVNGSLVPAVSNSGACASGTMSASVQHLNTSYAFSPAFSVTNQANPEYNGHSKCAL